MIATAREKSQHTRVPNREVSKETGAVLPEVNALRIKSPGEGLSMSLAPSAMVASAPSAPSSALVERIVGTLVEGRDRHYEPFVGRREMGKSGMGHGKNRGRDPVEK